MPLSTPNQRAELRRTRDGLTEVYSALPRRFWATGQVTAAYETVLSHLDRWLTFEEQFEADRNSDD